MMGRFLQTDPIGSKDDLDLYAYVADDPIDGIDPTGNDGVPGVPTAEGTWNRLMGQSGAEAKQIIDMTYVNFLKADAAILGCSLAPQACARGAILGGTVSGAGSVIEQALTGDHKVRPGKVAVDTAKGAATGATSDVVGGNAPIKAGTAYLATKATGGTDREAVGAAVGAGAASLVHSDPGLAAAAGRKIASTAIKKAIVHCDSETQSCS